MDPPGPVLPVRICAPGGEHAVAVPMLLDTGADCTLVPARIVHRLALPHVGYLRVTGLGGQPRRAKVYAAWMQFAGVRRLAQVVAFDDEAVLGRDLMNHAITTLNGPALTLSLRRPRRR